MLRHVVINVLRLDKSLFGGISVKRKELTWDDEKLLKLMLPSGTTTCVMTDALPISACSLTGAVKAGLERHHLHFSLTVTL